MPTIQEHVSNLCDRPHRGTTSEYEKEAAGYVARQLKDMGFTVETEEFTAPTGALYRTFIMIAVCEIGAAIFSLGRSGASIIVALFPFIYIGIKFFLMWPIDNLLFPTGKSQNVVGRLENPGAKNKVILMAHIDTQLGSYLFKKPWIEYQGLIINAAFVCSAVMAILAAIRVAGGSGPLLGFLQVILVVLFLAELVIFMAAEITGQYVQGAGDDASGVAIILAAAEQLKDNPPKNTEVWVMAAGAEETGQHGIMHFLNKGAGKKLDRKNTYFINHDNLGGGYLKYLTGEFVKPIKYRGNAVKYAEKVNMDPKYPNASPGFWDMTTDAMSPTLKGYSAVTIFAYNDHHRSPNYHLPSDTVENVDFDLMEGARRFTLGIVSKIDEEGGVSGQ